MESLQRVFMKKKEFDDGDKSLWLVFLRKFSVSVFCQQKRNEKGL